MTALFQPEEPSAKGLQIPLTPFWHTPNDFDADGLACSVRRPARSAFCPVFGVKNIDNAGVLLSQREIEEACAKLGFRSCSEGTYLLPTGECGGCPDGWTAQGLNAGETLHCQKGEETRAFDNPFDCLKNAIGDDSGAGKPGVSYATYRPCYEQSNAQAQVEVPEFYLGFNRPNQQILNACKTAHLGAANVSTEITLVYTNAVVKDVVTYPLILGTTEQQIEPPSFGYLQCPVKNAYNEDAQHSFQSPFWMVVYGVYLVGLAYLLLYGIYKVCVEAYWRNKSRKRWAKQDRKMVLEVSDLSGQVKTDVSEWFYEGYLTDNAWSSEGSPGQSVGQRDKNGQQQGVDGDGSGMRNVAIQQELKVNFVDDTSAKDFLALEYEGVRASFLASIARIVLWGLCVGWFVLLLIVVLDIYGAFLWSFCSVSAQKACEAVSAEGNSVFTFREGYGCAKGCLLSNAWITGVSPFWPYYRGPYGGYKVDAIFIIVWHGALAWVLLLKGFQRPLSNFLRIRCPPEFATSMRYVPKGRKPEFRMTYPVIRVEGFPPWFDAEGCRYRWSDKQRGFVVAKAVFERDAESLRRHVRAGGLKRDQVKAAMAALGNNHLLVEVPSFTSTASKEFFDWFYIYEFFCLWIWAAFHYWQVACVIAIAILLSGLFKVRARRNALFEIQRLTEQTTVVSVMREGNIFRMSAAALVPGDVLCISENDVTQEVVADSVIVNGVCSVDESALTGEPVSVIKSAPGRFETLDGGNDAAEFLEKQKKHCLFAGTRLDAVYPDSDANAEKVLCVILGTGCQTCKGKYIREMLHPIPFIFQLEEQWYNAFCLCLLWGCFVFVLCSWLLHGTLSSWFYGVSTISQIISPLIPAVFIWAKSASSERLFREGIRCVNPDRITVAGKISTFCFDKTGTLTQLGMQLSHVVYLAPQEEETGPDSRVALRSESDSRRMPLPVRRCLQAAHELVHRSIHGSLAENVSVTRTESQSYDLLGSEIDRKMFAASNSVLVFNESGHWMVQSDIGELEILRRFPFDHTSALMTSVVRDRSMPSSQVVYAFTKGSPEAVIQRVKPHSRNETFASEARRLALLGFYVLGLACKTIESERNLDFANRGQVEQELEFLGLLVFTNRLKPMASDVIAELKDGSIRPVMLTGDSPMTAAHVARKLGFCEGERILLGQPLRDNDHLPSDGVNSVNSCLRWKDVATEESVALTRDVLREVKAGRITLAVTGEAFEILSVLSVPGALESNGLLEALDVTQQRDGNALGEPFQNRGGDNLTPIVRHGSISGAQLLAPYVTVYARMRPEQKVQAVTLYMNEGITGMCGDGANDAGALRAAHVGIGLGSEVRNRRGVQHQRLVKKHALIAAPFHTPWDSLNVVAYVAREGRAALANCVAAYKNLMVYGEVMVAVSLIMYYFGVNLSEPYWIVVDSLINMGMAWCITRAAPSERLTRIPPTASLLGVEVVCSVVLQLVINAGFLCLSIWALFQQKFFLCREFDPNLVEQDQWWAKAENYESAVLTIVSYFQLINTAGVYSFGFDYREPWCKNYPVVVYWLIMFILGFVTLFLGPSGLSCLFRVNCGDQSLLSRWAFLGLARPLGSIESFAPEGCSCREQVLNAPLCDSEYVRCRNTQWHQGHHHNIMPIKFQGLLLLIVITNTVIAYGAEWLLIVGPCRSFLRKRADTSRASRERSRKGSSKGRENRQKGKDLLES